MHNLHVYYIFVLTNFFLLYTWHCTYICNCLFFYSFYSVLEDVKAIHRDIGRNVAGYISHPINQFHLTRRLYHQWREVLQRILNSDTCVKGKPKNPYIDILPNSYNKNDHTVWWTASSSPA